MCCRKSSQNEPDANEAISSIVGEMLMLTMVVIIIALVSVNAQSFLPSAREPSVTVKVENSSNTVTFYHKGGDAIKVGEIRVLINATENSTFLLNGQRDFDPNVLFDLGSRIDAQKPDGNELSSGESLRLTTSRAVIYSGVVP